MSHGLCVSMLAGYFDLADDLDSYCYQRGSCENVIILEVVIVLLVIL